MASLVGKAFARRWRFFIFGLPPKSEKRFPQAEETGDLHALEKGIACQNGAHLDSHGAYLPQLTLGTDDFIQFRFLQKQQMFPKIKRVEGEMVSLASEGDRNYYRWLLETLPRLRYLDEAALRSEWLYCCQKEAFHRESIQIFRLAPKLVPSNEHKFVQASVLKVPKFVDEREPWVLPWLRSTILPFIEQKTSSSPLKIYISRHQASGRRLRNESELFQALQLLGYTFVCTEDLSWLDQIRLFRDAESLVAPHGAGLANIVFCAPQTKVIELIANEYPFSFYPEICRRLDLNHQFLICDAVDPRNAHSSDLSVDVTQLLRLLS